MRKPQSNWAFSFTSVYGSSTASEKVSHRKPNRARVIPHIRRLRHPVIEDDPLLQSEADNWSDEEDFSAAMNNAHLPPIYPPSFVESSSSK
ncbi:hypothetical protein M405DRAFT_868333 [Rhizopogon salebrosus TDB-379]|nr:hypothetical protein M405DRAFT_868333 [Rhizopogon salebrosus TDB-379]